jgi:glycosyltransferase involved in cell wall biosynthesis
VTSDNLLSINYLLEDTSLYGGVKVVFHHAGLLRRSGHRVRVVSPGPRPEWYDVGDDFVQVPALEPEQVPEADLHVATFWTTLEPACSMRSGRAVHFCQGFEAALEHNADHHPAIVEAYSRRVPTWTVSAPLAELNRQRFGRDVRLTPPALERFWRSDDRVGPNSRPRVLVPHPFEFYMKGVDTALGAVELLLEHGVDLDLVRLSQWPLSDAERSLLEPDEFHRNLPPAEVAALVAGCDLVLAPSWASEGFGLAVLEAMACGVPVIASEIPSHRSFATGAAVFAPVGDAGAFAAAAEQLLADSVRWRRHREAGLQAAERFSEEAVTPLLDEAARWAASRP